MEESLDLGWPRADESPDADPEWSIRQVRRAVIEHDLNAKLAALALLTDQAGLPQRSPTTRQPRGVPIIAESHHAVAESAPAVRKRRHRPLHLVEATSSDSETTAVLDAIPEEGRAGNEAPSLDEVAVEQDLAASTEGAAERATDQTEAWIDDAANGQEPAVAWIDDVASGQEPAVEPPPVEAGRAEALYDLVRTRRTVTVLTGGVLALVAIGALFVWTAGVPVALSVPGTDSSAVDDLTVSLPPTDEADSEPKNESGAVESASTAEGGVDSFAQDQLEPVPGVAEREADPGLEASALARGESPSDVRTATIDAPGYDGVNLRRGPTTSAPAIRVIPTGTQVELLDGRVEDEGMAWQQIRASDGETGWVVSGTIQR